MNILQLRYFEVIAQYQNLSKAAQELMVSQPALSNVLSQLEAELGVSLFDRGGKKLAINTAGKLFLQTTKNILHLLDDSVSNLKHQQEIVGQLRICFHIHCAALFDTISAFTEYNPDVQFYFYTADKLTGDSQLSAFDLAVLPDFECGSLPSITLGESSTCYAVLPRSHRLADRAAIELKELKEEYFYFASSKDGTMGRAYNRCIEAGFTPKVRYISDSSIAHQPILLTGTAITITYNINSLYFQRWDDLVVVPIRDNHQTVRKINLCLTSESPSRLANTFWSFVQDRHRGTAAPDVPLKNRLDNPYNFL